MSDKNFIGRPGQKGPASLHLTPGIEAVQNPGGASLKKPNAIKAFSRTWRDV
jgi:hypothetical protein